MKIGIIENLKIIALITLAIYPIIKHSSFKRIMLRVASQNEKAITGVYFGFLSIVGSLVGVVVFNNIRIQGDLIGPVTAGIIGGPIIGLIAGAIGAMYRFSIDNITRLPDILSILIAGLIGGLFYTKYKQRKVQLIKIYAYGFAVELIRLGLILWYIEPRILAGPYYSMIGVYMLFLNPLGVTLLLSLVKDIQYNQNLTGATYAEKSLEIARQSLHMFRNGYTHAAMQEITSMIFRYVEASAVVVYNEEGAYTYAGTDHMKKWVSERVQQVWIKEGQRYYIEREEDIAVLKAPILLNNKIAGELQFIKSSTDIVATDIKMIEGIASFLSLQIQNTIINDQEKLLIEWEFNALKAQVNPHFLYNALNVIKTMVRLDAEKSQELIINLADFYRRSLSEREDLIPFIEELKLIKSYMDLQVARFGDRVELTIDVNPSYYDIRFPSFTIQPLIENSIIHGLDDNENTMLNIHLETIRMGDYLTIRVSDNGVGFNSDIIDDVNSAKHRKSESGIGLKNIDMRLKSMYHDDYQFEISNTTEGALVTMKIPIDKEVESIAED